MFFTATKKHLTLLSGLYFLRTLDSISSLIYNIIPPPLKQQSNLKGGAKPFNLH